MFFHWDDMDHWISDDTVRTGHDESGPWALDPYEIEQDGGWRF